MSTFFHSFYKMLQHFHRSINNNLSIEKTLSIFEYTFNNNIAITLLINNQYNDFDGKDRHGIGNSNKFKFFLNLK